MNKRVRSSSQGGCLATFTFLLLVGIIFGLISEFSTIEEGSTDSRILSILLLLIFSFIGWVVKISTLEALKEKAKKNSELLKTDTRCPILYLRPFNSDKDTHDAYSINQSVGNLNLYSLLGKVISMRITYEQQLAFTLNQVGPLIALSAPDSNEVSIGATKLKPITGDWQKVVNDFLDKCTLIIMRVGDSDGLMWEIEQIAQKGYLDKLIIYVQFPGLQDEILLNARFRKFDQKFSKLTMVRITQTLGKNRYLFFVNNQPKLSKTLSEALNEIGFIVEKSTSRGHMKGRWPGADNCFRKPNQAFEKMPNVIRCLLYFFFSALTVSLMYSLTASINIVWENCPYTLILVLLFPIGWLVGIVVGRISVLLNVAGGRVHILWGLALMLLSIYVYFSILWRTWDLLGFLNHLNNEVIDEYLYVGLFIHLLCFIYTPFIFYTYTWSKAEQKISRKLSMAIAKKEKI